jgi:hypothetical protein
LLNWLFFHNNPTTTPPTTAISPPILPFPASPDAVGFPVTLLLLLAAGIDIVRLPIDVNIPSLAPWTGGMLVTDVPMSVKSMEAGINIIVLGPVNSVTSRLVEVVRRSVTVTVMVLDARTGSKRFVMAGTIGTTSARRAATTGGSRRTATLLKPRFVMQFWLSGCQAQAVAAAVMVVRGSYVKVTTVVPTNSAEARLKQLNRCNSIVKRRGGLARAPMPDKVIIFVVGIM